MKQLHEAKGTKFIIGVPLHDNNEALVKAIIKKAKAALGDALLGIELGNEPMYWPCPGVVSAQGGNDFLSTLSAEEHCFYDSKARDRLYRFILGAFDCRGRDPLVCRVQLTSF